MLITEPARQAGRPASRWRRTLGDPRPGVPRSPHHAAHSARRLHRHRLRRLLPDPGHRPVTHRRPTSPARRGSQGIDRTVAFSQVWDWTADDIFSHLGPAHRANQPGIQQAPRTRCTCFPATSLTHYRRQQPRLRPRRLAPPRLARPVRATSSRATSDGRVHLTISYPRARPSQQLLRRWGISTARPWRAFDGARTPDRRRWCWCWLVTTAADHQQEQHGAITAQELGSLALTDVT